MPLIDDRHPLEPTIAADGWSRGPEFGLQTWTLRGKMPIKVRLELDDEGEFVVALDRGDGMESEIVLKRNLVLDTADPAYRLCACASRRHQLGQEHTV